MILKDAIKRLFFMKNKLKYYLTIFLSFVIFSYFSIGAYCVETPDSQPNFEDAETISILEDIDWRKLASAIFSIKGIVGDAVTGDLTGFIEYDVNHNNSLEQHPFSGIRNNANGTKTYDIDKDVRQEIFNYINENVANTPLSYSIQRIYSYNAISSQLFNTQVQMQAFKNEITKLEGINYIFIPNYLATSNQTNGQIMYYDEASNQEKTVYIGNTDQGVRAFFYYAPTNGIKNIDFINSSGHVNNYQYLTTLTPYSNWQSIANWNSASNKVLPTGWKGVIVWPNGQVKASTGLFRPSINAYRNTNLLNNASNANTFSIFSTKGSNEETYVFDSLQALKNFNVQEQAPYYIKGNPLSTVPDNNYIDTEELDRYGNSYSEVVNNIQNGWTAEQVIQLVDLVLSSGSGGGSGGGSGSSENNQSKWWERIGNAIGNLIDGIVDVLTTIIEKLSDALLSIIHLLTGYTDDGGVYHEGIFNKLTALVNSGFNDFISSIFSWMPEEIVTILTATLVFGIFFGIFKLLRR